MKLITCLALFACALGTVRAAEEAKPAAAAPAKKPEAFILVDFRNTPSQFAYGSFNGQVGPTKDGLLISKPASGKGGCGADCQLNLDDAKYVEFGLATLGLNEAQSVQIMFEDEDGTNAAYRYNIGQLVPGTPVWMRVPVNGAAISKPGSNGVLDVGKIVKWHIQGDWATDKTVQIMAIALRARR